jgi:hypothetical protein
MIDVRLVMSPGDRDNQILSSCVHCHLQLQIDGGQQPKDQQVDKGFVKGPSLENKLPVSFQTSVSSS